MIKNAASTLNKCIHFLIDISKSYLELGFGTKYLMEIFFLVIVFTLFFLEKETLVLWMLLIWSVSAFFGFLIPNARISSVIMLPESQRVSNGKLVYPGVPLHIEMVSRGGYIAGKVIDLNVSIIEIDEKFSSKERFSEVFHEVQVVYFHSLKAPINRSGKFLKGSPEAGGVTLGSKDFSKKERIVFQSSGPFYPTIFYKLKGQNENKMIPPDTKDSNPFPHGKIQISPHESYLSIRNNAIMYSLTIATIILALIQAKII